LLNRPDSNYALTQGITMKVISKLVAKLARNQKRRQGIAELNQLSDKELNDIGIARYDIKRVIMAGEK
jgi:uncharacterized protein YjiS (DUF1127 family)